MPLMAFGWVGPVFNSQTVIKGSSEANYSNNNVNHETETNRRSFPLLTREIPVSRHTQEQEPTENAQDS